MTIRLTFEANLDPLKRARTGFRKIKQIAEETGQKVAQETEINLVADLQQTPGKVKYPIAWTTEKQRRAFFATDGFGKGIPTKRTGALANAWIVTFHGEGTRFNVVVQNEVPASRFVYGSLAQNLSQAARFQQGFHKTTGWPLASPIVQFWLQEAMNEWRRQMIERISQETGIVIKQRAYTSPQRPS